MLQWENKEEELEEPLRDHQAEEDRPEEEDLQLQEEQQDNQSLQQQTSKPWGKTPPLFKGERSKADTFMNEVEKYLTLNDDVAGFKSPKKKVVLVLTFMQGP